MLSPRGTVGARLSDVISSSMALLQDIGCNGCGFHEEVRERVPFGLAGLIGVRMWFHSSGGWCNRHYQASPSVE